MEPEAGSYIYTVVGIVLAIALFVGLSIYERRRQRTNAGHSWWSFLLLWPLILDTDKDTRDGRFLTKREWIGWGLVGLIIVVGIVFTPSFRGG